MADFTWPEDIVPYACEFRLQPHIGGSESPFSRVSKLYGLSAPRWVCRISVRGGDSVAWGREGVALWGQRLDAFLAKLEGRLNRVALHDFRRSEMSTRRWPAGAGNLAAAAGATSLTITGLAPGQKVFAGDYLGGDGRPHIILDDVAADGSGQATVSFKPPLRSAVGANAAIFGKVTGMFRLVSDDSNANPGEVGQLTHYELEFVEDL